MKKWFLTGLVCASLVAQAGDLELFKGLSGTLNIAGGTAHIDAEKEAIKSIMQAYPSISITIAGGGSGVGIKQLSEGLIDMANSGRAPKPEEVERANLKSFVFAIDGIGVVVHPKSPLKNLTTAQIIDVFSGKIKTFKELGVDGKEINLYVREASSGTREVFSEKAIRKGDIASSAKVVASNAAMKTAISSDVNGIGFISLGVADESVKLLCIDEHCPSVESVLNGSYPVSRGLYIITKGEPNALAKAFIAYMKSTDGIAISKKHGFLPPAN